MDMCVYDTCEMEDAKCDSLSVFSDVCEDLGYIVDWRTAAGCGKYSFKGIRLYLMQGCCRWQTPTIC